MMIHMDGRLWGNALKDKDGKWPKFEVGEGWLDYDFRKGR
jgi:hypothetical protein